MPSASPQRRPGPNAGFAIYYRDPEGSFKRAAETWGRELGAYPIELLEVRHLYEVDHAFRKLQYLAKSRDRVYFRGALYLHGDAPSNEGDTGHGLQFAPLKSRTLAEGRYREEVLEPQGLSLATGHASLLKSLPRLPWTPSGRLDVYACMSGVGEPSVAQTLAKGQGVPTAGQQGKAYFSKSRDRYEEIGRTDSTVYLRAYYRGKNVVLDALGADIPTRWFGSALPEKVFSP